MVRWQDLISDTAGSQSRFYLWDALGNLRSLLSPTGTVLWQGDWSAFGGPVCPAGAPPTSYAWKGHFGAYTDGESKLVEMGARYYAPNLARFLTRDPSGFSAGANLYTYCADDPVNFFDATGRWPDIPNLIDDYLLGGATKRFGETAGRYDSGKASAWDVARDGTLWGVQLAGAAFMVKDLGQLGWNLAKKGWNLAGCLKTGGCFVAGVPVWTVVGKENHASSTNLERKGGVGKPRLALKPVEEVKRGDRVVSRDPKTGRIEEKRVERTTVRTVAVVVSVGLAEAKSGKVVDTLTATREHPFYVRGTGCVPAGGLAIGNAIVTRAGPDLIVKSLKWHRRAEGYKVYNFVVEDDHSYFVGLHNGGAWVHNPGQCGMLGKAETQSLENKIATDLENGGWKITHGAGRGPQEAILDPAWQPTGRPGRPAGTVFPDITATKNNVTLRIQTADTYQNGTLTRRELRNLNRILQRKPGDQVYWFPKNGEW